MHKRKGMPRDGAAERKRAEEEPTKADLTQARVRRMDPWHGERAEISESGRLTGSQSYAQVVSSSGEPGYSCGHHRQDRPRDHPSLKRRRERCAEPHHGSLQG